MRNRTKYLFGGACGVLVIALITVTLSVNGCKSNKDKKNIDELKSKLKAMLKNPVDMRSARVDKAREKLSKELSALLKKPDAKRRAKLIKLIGSRDTLKSKLLGDEIIAVNTSIDRWTTDGKPAGVLITNTGDKPLTAQLSLGCGAPPERLPITAIVDDGSAKKKKYVFKEMSHLQVTFPPVPAKSKRLFIITTDKTWIPGTYDKRKLGVRFSAPLQPFLINLAKNPNPWRRAKLLKAIAAGQVTDYLPLVRPYMGLIGVDPNFWTTAAGPAGLPVNNPDAEPYVPEFTLSCNAPAASLPLTATFDDGTTKTRFVFRKAGARLVSLPAVPARSRVLYLVTTNKTYINKADKKSKIGVRITSPIDGGLRSLLNKPDAKRRAKLLDDLFRLKVDRINMLGEVVVAVGLSGDRWTVGGEPAGIAVDNWSKRALRLELKVGCGAHTKAVLPITAIIEDGKQKQKKVFNSPGETKVTLPPVPPGTKRLFIVTTDKTWTPGTHDKRWLGINVEANIGKVLHTLLRGATPKVWAKMANAIMLGNTMDRMPMLEDSVVALGLSPDRWTVNGMPAAVVINNKGGKAWKASLVLSMGAAKKALPITATLDDGVKKIRVEFKKAETRTVALPPVGSHKKRLYLITTDKTWSLSKEDSRILGVNVSVPKKQQALPPTIPPEVQAEARRKAAEAEAKAKAAAEARAKQIAAEAAKTKAAHAAAAKGAAAKGAPAKGMPAKGVPAKAAPAKVAPKKTPVKVAPKKTPVKKR